jgi:hypothetical protein
VYYFAEKFMLWSAFQALVMLVQNRYQKRRMYTRIAMGKNSAMDVVSGESSGSAGQLMVLYPMLFRKLTVMFCTRWKYKLSSSCAWIQNNARVVVLTRAHVPGWQKLLRCEL